MDRVRLLIQGTVQGVGFRYFVMLRAREIGLAGEVRNLGDRSVETIAEGSRAGLEDLLEAVRVGPRAARVTRVVVEWSEGAPQYQGFHISDRGDHGETATDS